MNLNETPPIPKIDRSIESEVLDLINRLQQIRLRLIDVHNELEAIAEHRDGDGFYVSLGANSVFPDLLVRERIKELMADNLLKEKGNLHDKYRVLTGSLQEGVLTNTESGERKFIKPRK